MAYNIIFNNKSNEELDIQVTKRPFIPVPTRRFKEIEIKGHDGKYYLDEETYDDIIIPTDFSFIENDLDNIRSRVRNIKYWIENVKNNRLILSDDPDVFYKVCKAELGNVTYENLYEIQNFTVNFTCKSYQYLITGQKEIQLQNVLFNHWDKCTPTYRIVGNGICAFSINNTIVNCTVNGELLIDTEFDKILNSDRTLAIGKTDIKRMQDLYLQEKRNTFNWTSGFTIYITPKWRTI
ncbi:distal tail protein Dit [Clostridium saccharoperbutylacetonicum]|uniref:distal tail protein Dit n=1 Tax=Clostridium saccharoperbutylacetonicum TaxID=36745 RepID=UPI0039E7E7A4